MGRRLTMREWLAGVSLREPIQSELTPAELIRELRDARQLAIEARLDQAATST